MEIAQLYWFLCKQPRNRQDLLFFYMYVLYLVLKGLADLFRRYEKLIDYGLFCSFVSIYIFVCVYVCRNLYFNYNLKLMLEEDKLWYQKGLQGEQTIAFSIVKFP